VRERHRRRCAAAAPGGLRIKLAFSDVDDYQVDVCST